MTGFEPATTGSTIQGSTAELHPPWFFHDTARHYFELKVVVNRISLNDNNFLE